MSGRGYSNNNGNDNINNSNSNGSNRYPNSKGCSFCEEKKFHFHSFMRECKECFKQYCLNCIVEIESGEQICPIKKKRDPNLLSIIYIRQIAAINQMNIPISSSRDKIIELLERKYNMGNEDSFSRFEVRCHIEQLPVRELKKYLIDCKVNIDNCIERSDLISKLISFAFSLQEEEMKRLFRITNTQNNKQQKTQSADDDDELTCKICFELTSNCIFLECGHLMSCMLCGVKLKECPICRSKILRTIEVFR